KGRISLVSDIHLLDALWLPCFKYNLLSVKRLADDMEIDVLFSSDYCLFQDRKSRKI
ncbi:hypothetical protein M569_07503, partial [Genlisea aurea]